MDVPRWWSHRPSGPCTWYPQIFWNCRPPSSAFHATYQYCLSANLANSWTPLPPLCGRHMYMVPKQAATGRDPDVADHQIVEGGGKGFFQLPTTINMSIHFLLTLKMLWVALCPPPMVCFKMHSLLYNAPSLQFGASKCNQMSSYLWWHAAVTTLPAYSFDNKRCEPLQICREGNSRGDNQLCIAGKQIATINFKLSLARYQLWVQRLWKTHRRSHLTSPSSPPPLIWMQPGIRNHRV